LNFEPWYNSIKDIVIKEVRARGQMWDQRK